MSEETNNLIKILVEKENLSNADIIINNWYLARSFAENELKEKLYRIDGNPLHIVIEGASPIMCAVIREIILRAHYVDFVEPFGNTKMEKQSCITVVCADGEIEKTKETLRSVPFLGNYLTYLWGDEETPRLDFLDVDVEVVEKSVFGNNKPDVTEKQLSARNDAGFNKSINIQLAKHANSIYSIGTDLYNLPDINPTDVAMYKIPLRVFEATSFNPTPEQSWLKLKSKGRIKDMLSNVFCTDIFEQRRATLERDLNDGEDLESAIERKILELSRSEHSRWVAEKLILGFKPWTNKDHYEYSRLFGDEKKKYHDNKKEKGIHYNICSYHDLSRLDPNNRKFDTFLVLTMLDIIDKAEKDSKGQ